MNSRRRYSGWPPGPSRGSSRPSKPVRAASSRRCDLVLPPGGELVLVVDQLEEVFTLTAAGRERELFLEALRVASVDPESRIS